MGKQVLDYSPEWAEELNLFWVLYSQKPGILQSVSCGKSQHIVTEFKVVTMKVSDGVYCELVLTDGLLYLEGPNLSDFVKRCGFKSEQAFFDWFVKGHSPRPQLLIKNIYVGIIHRKSSNFLS